MLVSFDWLKQYVATDLSAEEVARRLMFAGLNDDGVTQVGGDYCLNLEVTSNRPDCLGMIGIAREAAVLLGTPLKPPAASPVPRGQHVDQLASVALECPELCPRYTARIITGVKIASSPGWLVKRLETIGIAAVNNVVDITNYVLMECGQPLHAFDLAKLAGRKIIVRNARPGEKFLAINHKEYTLDESMCVIADAQRPVALGGVMGGADSEVSAGTSELLIEAAEFVPLSIRSTARKLALHSDSSYRFERLLDPEGVDWASRRCCELILELAGGELAEGVIDAGRHAEERQSIVLRFSQLKRVLGIDVPSGEARRILAALGNRELRADASLVEVLPPSWRRDLEREIDLVEEVARVHGYDKIPEDASVPMFPSHQTDEDRLLVRCRDVLAAAGLDEALTLSAVEESWSAAFSPWTDAAPLLANMPILRRADRLRRSLVPSLLAARRLNESQSNPTIELFEIAKVYLPSARAGELPSEPRLLAITSGSDFRAVKGIVEGLVSKLNRNAAVTAQATNHVLFGKEPCCMLHVCAPDGEPKLLGYIGTLDSAALKQFELRGKTTVAEISLSVLLEIANLIPQYAPLPTQPAVGRDLNFVVPEEVLWSELARTVQAAGSPEVEALQFVDVYRDESKLGPGLKSLLMSVKLRRADATLTSEQADAICGRIVSAVKERHAGVLRA
jgi:phenylalanyl-tRNA synthetase beta chain